MEMRCCTPPTAGGGEELFSSCRHLCFANDDDDGIATLESSITMRPSQSLARPSESESRPSDGFGATFRLPSPPREPRSPRRAFQPIPLNLPPEHCYGRTSLQGWSTDGLSTGIRSSSPWPPTASLDRAAAPAQLPPPPSYLQTPEVQRVAMANYAAANMSHLLYTPQIPQVYLAWRSNLDAELDPVNAQHPPDQLPPVTALLEDELYIGGFPDAQTVPLLQSMGICHIINCCAQDVFTCPEVSGAFCVHNLHCFDVEDYLILHNDYEHFSRLVSTLLAGGEKVFVHCIAGINRSVTLCAAYLMDRLSLTPVEAVRVFRGNGRMRILDNKGFRHQLVDHYLQSVEPRMAEHGLL